MRTLYNNIRLLTGILPIETRLVKGKAMNELQCIENAFLVIENSTIIDFGEMQNAPENADRIIDLTNKTVLPTWCDSHTHLVFAKWRETEFTDRLNGLTYEQIAERGGGILNSAKVLQNTSEEELLDSALERLHEIKQTGTAAVEIKSGYGLSIEGELKMLRVIKKLKEKSDLTIKATFLGAHSYPMEFRPNHEGYLDILINRLLPKIADENLADFVDVFCDVGFFSPDETSRILEASAKFNLRAKIHANELAVSGGVEVGVKHNALSVDHLERVEEEQISALLQSETMPTILPSASFFLKIPYAPARKMIDSGLPLAIATDYNPGSSPTGNIPFIISLACINAQMSVNEAINAATINGAYAMNLEHKTGSISKGKKANFIITKNNSSLDFIPYRMGNTNWIERVVVI